MAENETQYLILAPDGSRPSMFLTNRAGVEEHLKEMGDFVGQGGYEGKFLDAIPTTDGHTVNPGRWNEEETLILEVRVVVPQPVTTRWQIAS